MNYPTSGFFPRTLAVICLVTSFLVPVLAPAQAIAPVWEYLINNLPAPLPILTNATPTNTDQEIGDGHWPMPTLSALKRYDNNRLILGIRENGINETDPNLTQAQRTLATNYPDRSLIWINPTNGAPMGIALNIGLYPVPLDADFISTSIASGVTDYTNQYWWSFDISADGYIYTGYKNKVIRYAPNGSGGISPVPQVVFTLDTNTVATVHGNLYTSAGRFPKLRVTGTGTNTVLLVGGNSGTRGYLRLFTTNGNTFAAGAFMPGGFGSGGGGGASSLVPSQDPANPTDEWSYSSSYPGNSSGNDTTFYRFITTSPFLDPANNFVTDASFTAQPDVGSNAVRYAAHFIGDVDANPELNYVVAYSTPSYNSIGLGIPQTPGWLAIHDSLSGSLIGSYRLNVTEADELLSLDQAALFQSTIGYVTLNVPTNGPVEVLWSSPVYGYGRYLVSDNAKRFALNKTINTVWEYLDGPTNAVWPIINDHVDPGAPVHNDNTATMTMLTGLKRYDANRLLLAIRDNGINETVSHNTNLANQFPDRSLQWVDAATGKPLGTAFVVNYSALGYPNITENRLQNMAFGVDAGGVVYVGVADKIFRYAPAGDGTNFLAPTVAFDAFSSQVSYSPDMLFANFRVTGSGANTVLFVGNKDWYGPDGYWYLTTTDGTNFSLGGPQFTQYDSSDGGGNSAIVPDPGNPNDNIFYDTKYPSTSNGVDSTLGRRRQVGGTGPFVRETWSLQQLAPSSITNSSEVLYRTYFLTDVQTLPGLDYVVSFSTPSYNTYATTYPLDPNIYNGGDSSISNALRGASSSTPNYQPGWLVIHDQATGDVRGLHLLNVSEALTLIPPYPFPAPHADTTMGNFQDEIPQGGVEMYPLGNGAEVLWWSTTYGIGRYTIDSVASTTQPRLSIKNVPGGMVRLDWTGQGTLQFATDISGPYTSIPTAVSGYTFVPGTGNNFFRVLTQ